MNNLIRNIRNSSTGKQLTKFGQNIINSKIGKQVSQSGQKIMNSKTGKQIKNSPITKNLNKKISKLSSPQKIGGIILILVVGNLLFGGSKWDDKTINNKVLQDFCKLGKQGNSLNGKGYGYNMYIFQGRVAVGNTTSDDYDRLEKWFKSNCYEGW